MKLAIEIAEDKIGALATTRFVAALVSSLYEADLAYLRLYPGTPPLLRSGVRYQKQAALSPVDRLWYDIPTALREGVIDCKGAAAWYAAEETVRGRLTVPFVVWSDRDMSDGTERRMFHVVVRDERTRVLRDPSIAIGMRT